MTRVVITGASGNVGTALLKRLADAGGYDVVGVTRRRPPSSGIYQTAQWHQLDLADANAEAQLELVFRDADAVVHLAWGFQPTRNISYLEAVGVGGTRAVLNAADAAGVGQLIHMSSVGTYAAGRYGQYVDETWSTAGIDTSPYSRHKSAAESLLDAYEAGSGDVTITRMRPGFIVQRSAAGGFRRYALPAFVEPRWLRFLPVLPLDRELVIPIIHADDVADAFARALERGAGGPFNLMAEPPVRRNEVAKQLGAMPLHVPSSLLRPAVALSWRARLQPIDEGWLDMSFSVPLLDTTRAREVLDWTPQYTSAEALADMGQGFKHCADTESPVLSYRGPLTSMLRDLTAGPITDRHIP
ncbi:MULTISPECIES: NAD-dependent epimerase/dehydratase family protein [Mycobacteriaceae]|uniref:NAD-dependent epimerase/dehydratase family protein n=1 Tax=Mycobacteriaceae TaxID=1762 RepID=UPI0007FF224C|nr:MULTISPECIES: NAD-dependent epimerase/dehydratase family protein [Mycobacteriaceae]MCK0172971.1 NAD-dependent epimerase/dehydratase family protein [Mycolicibacterium sp. F2034L]OBB57900.1 epimerase [Mycobacterium sp. 852013-51886_SCH5428379]